MYANTMRAGQWVVNTDAIAFDTNNVLINGHHRLRAVIEAKTAVLMMVMRNLQPESILNIDTGVARSAADMLTFKNAANSNILAAVIRQVLLYDTDASKQALFSNKEIMDYYDSNMGMAAHINKDDFGMVCKSRSALQAAKHLLLRYHDDDKVLHFFQILDSGISHRIEDQIIQMYRNALIKRRENKELINPAAYVHKTIQVFGHWLRGELIKRFELDSKRGDKMTKYSAITLRRKQ